MSVSVNLCTANIRIVFEIAKGEGVFFGKQKTAAIKQVAAILSFYGACISGVRNVLFERLMR